MENYSEALKTDDAMELPPGFRFHPTDEELITHYLSQKVVDNSFSAIAIGEVDMNKVEPWELPWRAKMGEKEFYFFCVRDKKYPTGLRTNRATKAGYWKATGKDKEIFRGKTLVGMKKTLVFYRGRAPKGEKSNWVSHEYRLEGKFSLENLPKAAKNDWVISRVFHKTSGGKKVHISGLMRMNSGENEFSSSTLPPLMDPSPKPEASEPGHVHCFSNTIVDDPHKIQENMIINPMDTFAWGQFPLSRAPFPGLIPVPLQDPSIIKSFLANYGHNMNHGFENDKEMASVSQETTENSSVVSNVDMGKKVYEDLEYPVGAQDLDCIWSY